MGERKAATEPFNMKPLSNRRHVPSLQSQNEVSPFGRRKILKSRIGSCPSLTSRHGLYVTDGGTSRTFADKTNRPRLRKKKRRHNPKKNGLRRGMVAKQTKPPHRREDLGGCEPVKKPSPNKAPFLSAG